MAAQAAPAARRRRRLGPRQIAAGHRPGDSMRRHRARPRLAATTYAGINDCHLTELPAEREGIALGGSSLQRLVRRPGRTSPPTASTPSPQPARPDAQGRVAPPGRWLAPRLARNPGGTVNARGRHRRRDGSRDPRHVPRAGGLRGVSHGAACHLHGVPHAAHRDRLGAFETLAGAPLTLEEWLVASRAARLEELGITSSPRRSP